MLNSHASVEMLSAQPVFRDEVRAGPVFFLGAPKQEEQ